jgi:acyl-CoA thioesterase
VGSRFALDTAVEPLGGGRYRARMDRGWWIVRGPNGGYVAAMVLRAMLTELDDPLRPPRSLTVHYLRPPVEGEVEVTVVIERTGRALTTLSARLEQDGKLLALALCACAVDMPGLEVADLRMPAVPAAEDTPAAPASTIDIPMRQRYEVRPLFGGPLGEVDHDAPAVTGGWIRLAEAEPLDHLVVAALTDAWPPAVFARMESPAAVPTIDLTVHFRGAPPDAHEWALVQFATRHVEGGYLEEDGAIWSADGRLLAQSRQLAMVLPRG